MILLPWKIFLQLFCKIWMFLKNSRNLQTNIYLGDTLHWNTFSSKKKTPAQFFSCQFGKILKNTYSVEHIRVTAFGFPK